jgi:hypothetical protein
MYGMGRNVCRRSMEMEGMIGSRRNDWKCKELLQVEGLVRWSPS